MQYNNQSFEFLILKAPYKNLRWTCWIDKSIEMKSNKEWLDGTIFFQKQSQPVLDKIDYLASFKPGDDIGLIFRNDELLLGL